MLFAFARLSWRVVIWGGDGFVWNYIVLKKFETINSNTAESMEAYLSEALPLVSKK